jgi:hypothetical protein
VTEIVYEFKKNRFISLTFSKLKLPRCPEEVSNSKRVCNSSLIENICSLSSLKFHLPSSNLSLGIANKRQAKGCFGTVGISLIYDLQGHCLRKVAYFLKSLTPYFWP